MEPPDEVLKDPGARDILQVWVLSDGNLGISMRVAFTDARLWGVMLADLARHMAAAHTRNNTELVEAQVLDTILDVFQDKIAGPSTLVHGKFERTQ
jgi:hypothetical protein